MTKKEFAGRLLALWKEVRDQVDNAEEQGETYELGMSPELYAEWSEASRKVLQGCGAFDGEEDGW